MLKYFAFFSLTGEIWVLLSERTAKSRSTMCFGGQLIITENFYIHHHGHISHKYFKTELSMHACTPEIQYTEVGQAYLKISQ